MRFPVMTGIILYLALALARPAVASGDAMDNANTLIDFSDTGAKWYPINDGVMGGLSQSGLRRTEVGTGVFAGTLSLENNGGFASVRLALGRRDLSAFAGLEVRVRGDGRTYQLRLRTSEGLDGIAYRAMFETGDGEWTTSRIPFEAFVPTFRGQTLSDAAALDPSEIRQLAFMLADKNPGPFALEIDFVRAWTGEVPAP